MNEENKVKRSFKQKLLIVLGSILTFIGLFLFPIIGPLALEYAVGTLALIVLGIIILVFGLKKPKKPNI